MIGGLRVKVGGVYVPAGLAGGSVASVFFCTYATRPASPPQGQEIFETDTKNKLLWDGTGWQYLGASPGVITAQAGTTVPAGWLGCDGAFISKTTYASLFAQIGHTYNGGTDPGDGTFRLPDGRDRSLVGVGSSHPLAASDALSYGATRDAAFQHTHATADHSHAMDDHAHNIAGHLHNMDHGHYNTFSISSANDRAPGSGARGANPVLGSVTPTAGENVGSNPTQTSTGANGGVGNQTYGATSGAGNTTFNASAVEPWLGVKFTIKL